jgi:hypothetical protein
MAKKAYSFTSYIEKNAIVDVNFSDYENTPATAFLKQVVHLSDAINHCKRHFRKSEGEPYTKDSLDSIYMLSCATLASMMGHFETFERCLFAGLFELTERIPKFNANAALKKLKGDSSINITLQSLAGWRGRAATAGMILADNLGNWHEPEIVNSYIAAFVPDCTFFASDHIKELKVLWQLRHSIVHTGGTLTRPDAQKVPALTTLADQSIVVRHQFVFAVARRFHKIVKEAMSTLQWKLVAKAGALCPPELKEGIDQLCKVESPRKAWLKKR